MTKSGFSVTLPPKGYADRPIYLLLDTVHSHPQLVVAHIATWTSLGRSVTIVEPSKTSVAARQIACGSTTTKTTGKKPHGCASL